VAANLRMFANGMYSTTSSTIRRARSLNPLPLAARVDASSFYLIFFPTFFESPLAPPPTSIAGPCQPAPDLFRVITPTQSTSCQTLLKVAAVVHGDGPQTRQHLDHIAVEKYQIEVNDRFDRDVSEDAAVGAYIAATDGERRELARQPAPGIRGVGFRTSLWSVVVSHQVADADVLGLAEEHEIR
jgi:hypothetical protein